MKMIYAVLSFLLFLPAVLPAVEIYLKPQVTVDSRVVYLGDIARIKDSTAGVNSWAKIVVGQIKKEAQSVQLSYATINQLLLRKGRGEFFLIGATVRVSLAQTALSAEQYKQKILQYLAAKYKGREYEVIFKELPGEQSFPGRSLQIKIDSVAPLAGQAEYGFDLSVYSKGQLLAKKRVLCYVRLFKYILVATKRLYAGRYPQKGDFGRKRVIESAIPQGALLSHDLIKQRRIKHDINRGDTLLERLLEEPTLVVAGQSVTLSYSKGGVHITAPGRALRSGKRGEPVPCINLHTGRRVYAVVRKKGMAELSATGK